MDKADKKQVERKAAPWVEGLARFGYAAKGVVYITVGLLALQAALGVGGRTTDTEGALESILAQPFGRVLLVIIGVGLIGYVVWRLVQGIFDVEGKGRDLKGIVKRFGYVVSGFAYGGLALEAFRLMAGFGGGGGDDAKEHWTARFLAQPFGQWMVALGALIIVALAVNAVYVALAGAYRRKLKMDEMGDGARRWASVSAVAGLIARGVVFGVVAFFLLQAAWFSDAEKAGGLSETLTVLASQPFGPYLLGGVATGLAAYGVYAVVEARWRKIEVTGALR